MKNCYCGSPLPYAQCCQPYHLNLQTAQTPEILMRSRYSAYASANIDYIQATMRDKASIGFDPMSAKLWAQRVIWVKLQVLNAPPPSSTHGQVEFTASFVDNKKLIQMHEISDFLYTEGRWFYVGGQSVLQEKPEIPILRNTLCPCGSSKKWKHCHGKE